MESQRHTHVTSVASLELVPRVSVLTRAMSNPIEQKERYYALLAKRIGALSKDLAHTAELFQDIEKDIHAMKTFAGLQASQYAGNSIQSCYLQLC